MQRKFDLEDRTLRFARDVFAFIGRIPRTLPMIELCRQLARSASSVGANYREANEALGKNDFLMHLRISRKESKETGYWLQLSECRPEDMVEKDRLANEATQLMRIFAAIISKAEGGIPRKLT